MINVKPEDVIIPPKTGGEEMATIDCPKCSERGNKNQFLYNCAGDFLIRGTITCLKCQYERPFAAKSEFIRELGIALPGEESSRLSSSVPVDIKEDVQEAERANYSQCYKACVVMCRRALQLALIDKGIADKPLSKMLEEAKGTLVEDKTFNLATTIKGYGNIGTHRKEKLEPEEVRMVIYATVQMLNQIYK